MTISGSEARSIGMNDMEKDEEIERLKKRVEELEQVLRGGLNLDEDLVGLWESRAHSVLAKGRPQ